ncbi:unnamed protein product [Leuciscus chuanchicus]
MGNQNILALLLFAMAALHCGISESMDFIKGNCNDVIRLPCKAANRTTTYRYVIWYKIESTANPIIKRKNGEDTIFTNFTSVSLREKEALEFQNVQPSDSGEYKCYLAAEVGGRNDESSIRLNISECLHVSTVYPSTMIPDDSCPAVDDITVNWAVLGLSLFSMAKIILCIVTVGHRPFQFCCRKEKSYRNIIMLHIYFLMFHLVYFSMSIEEQRWIKIPCNATIEQGVKYRRITWYKVEEGSDVLAGLVSKDLLKNITTLFKFAHHSYEVGEDNSLLVPGTAEEDCGVYRCTLWPPLGHYIQEGNTEYYAADCIKPQVQAMNEGLTGLEQHEGE